MEQHHFVVGVAQAPHSPQHRVRLVQQVRDDDDDAAPAELLRRAVHDVAERGVSTGGGLGQRLHERAQVARARGGRQDAPHLLLEQAEPHGIPLAHDQVGQRGRHRARVFDLAQRPRAVLHGLGDVDEDPGAQVGLLLVLLDVEAVRLAVDLPVHVAHVVAGDVLAVLGELHAETAERRAVEPRHEPLDDQARFQVEARDPLEDLRIQVLPGVFRHRPLQARSSRAGGRRSCRR